MYISENEVKTAAESSLGSLTYSSASLKLLTHRDNCECHSQDDFGYRGDGRFGVTSHFNREEAVCPRLGNGRSARFAVSLTQPKYATIAKTGDIGKLIVLNVGMVVPRSNLLH